MQAIGAAMKKFGELNLLELLERTEEAGTRGYSYRVKFGEMSVLLSLELTKDNKYSQLAFAAE
jgi:hypothetical protein